MKISDIIESMQELRENLIIGSIAAKQVVADMYKSGMTEYEFDSKRFKYVLCGQIAELFYTKLKAEGLTCNLKRIFVWSSKIVNQHDLSDYDDYDKYIFDTTEVGTHALVELTIGNKIYIADPTVGLIYPYDMETLRTGKGVIASRNFLNQYEYIKNSYHMLRPYTHVYTTEIYWKHINKWAYRLEPFADINYNDNA